MKTYRFALLTLAFSLAACANRATVKNDAAAPNGPQQGAADAKAEPDVRADTMVQIPEVHTVHFDYDSAFLNAQARALLAENSRWLKTHKEVKVQVAGNCDERGTVEYNLALGQRRAAAVRSYYVHSGVAGRRIATISYGKERPVCNDSNEACWAQNRRAETLRAAPNSASRK